MSQPSIEHQDALPTAEQELLQRLRAGDDDAYAELVQAHIGKLLAVARRITRRDSDAEDVVQEAFLSAFKAIADFDGRARLSTWLHRIVVNTALMRLRAQRARPELAIESLQPRFDGGHFRDANPAWQPAVPDETARLERQDALWHALEQLPQQFRQVVVMRDLDGLESKQVAAELGISDALVRQRLHRGRQALVQLLAPAMEAPTP